MLDRKAANPADPLDHEAEQMALARLLDSRYASMLRAMHRLLSDLFQLGEDFRLDDAATRRLLEIAAERVVRIDETTRQAIREQLQLGQRLGLSTWEIANGKPDIGYRGIEGLYRETWAGRAEMIARTELQHAQVESAKDRYTASGLVDRVKIIDGDQADATCADRNGKTVALADAPSLAHPNCRLNLIPVLREGVA